MPHAYELGVDAAHNVLRHLFACERGLSEAYAAALREAPGPVRESQLLAHALADPQCPARALGERLRALGERVPDYRDETWNPGAPTDLPALFGAERASRDTWHDALSDLDPGLANDIQRGLLPDHDEIVGAWQ